MQRGDLSPLELLDACISRIELLNPILNAVIAQRFSDAREEAREATQQWLAMNERERIQAPALLGLPVLIKDIQDVGGMVTSYGSAEYAKNIARVDAGIVRRIRAQGGIVIGKTNVPELSIGANTVNPLFGATGNPHNPHLTAGGSSGGSAAALAAGFAPLATGSDHGGSLRIPASFCGVVGMRPTPGTVAHETRTITQTNYAVQGPMARTCGDAALLLSAIASRDARTRQDPMAFPLDAKQFADLPTLDLTELRIATTPDLGGVLVSKEIAGLFNDRVLNLSSQVRQCTPTDIDLSAGPDIDWLLRQDVFAVQHVFEAAEWDDTLNPNVRATWDAAMQTPMVDIARARRQQTQLYRDFSQLFDEVDVVLCPGVSIPPFPWRELNPQQIDGLPVQNYMAWLGLTSALTVIGHPVVTIPCGRDSRGTPFGIQVIGAPYEDHKLLAIAATLEAALQQWPETRKPDINIDLIMSSDADCRDAGKTEPFAT